MTGVQTCALPISTSVIPSGGDRGGPRRPSDLGTLVTVPSWFCCTGLLGGGNGLLVSRSAAKDLQPPGRINENLGIMRFCSVWMRVIRAFVADLDTRPTSGPSSNSWRCPLGSWCPSPGSRWCSLNVTSGRAPSGRLLHEGGAVLARGYPYCTRVGVYWSGVVRTARDPDLRGVDPTVGQ